MSVVDASFDHPLQLEERAAAPLAGGIMNHGYQCGMVWGIALAAGARAHQLYGPGPLAEAEAIRAAQRLVASFGARNGDVNCFGITGADLRDSEQSNRYFLRGGAIRCFSMAARTAPMARHEIDTAFSGDGFEAPAPPVSCTAVLAQRMGASEVHQVMAAGLAGGIGLSGGGCGALGAAIWINEMKSGAEGPGIAYINSPIAQAAMDRFAQAAGSGFECAKIVGRMFEDIDDHAAYVRDGGCAAIIEALATPLEVDAPAGGSPQPRSNF